MQCFDYLLYCIMFQNIFIKRLLGVKRFQGMFFRNDPRGLHHAFITTYFVHIVACQYQVIQFSIFIV